MVWYRYHDILILLWSRYYWTILIDIDSYSDLDTEYWPCYCNIDSETKILMSRHWYHYDDNIMILLTWYWYGYGDSDIVLW